MAFYSVDSVVTAQLDFAFNLLRKILGVNDVSSIIFSPVSVAMALAVILPGARNESEVELRKLLGGDASSDEINRHFSSVLQALNGLTNDKVTLQIANRAYVKSGYKILDTFKDFVGKTYGGGFESVDFGNKTEAVKIINGFVSAVTRGKIDNLISAADIDDELTRLIVVNAVYFKGLWKTQFDVQNTKKELFYSTPNTQHEVDMMNMYGKFDYYEDARLQCLRLTYISHTVDAYFILPRQRHGLGTVIDELNGSYFIDGLTRRMQWEKVVIKLPKFCVNSTHNVDELLGRLGLRNVFSPDDADFSAISGSRDLFINKICQKATIEVNESGSEASAATLIEMQQQQMGYQPPPRPIYHFHADQPFVVLLVHARKNILFIGTFSGRR